MKEIDPQIEIQAADLEQILPSLTRFIVGTPMDHPLAELPVAQLRLCNLLLRDGRRTMSQISDELRISVSAVTQMADRLEKAGMVERTAEPGGDRRTRHLQLTEHGDSLMQARRKLRVQRASQVLQVMPEEQRNRLFEALDLLLTASRSLPAPATSSETLL